MKKKFFYVFVLITLLSKLSISQDVKLISYSKFDFIAGEKVIFYDDFSQENIGDFPSRWNTNSSGEIVNISNQTGKWLQLKKEGAFLPETPVFPDNFTVEFDFIIHKSVSDNTYFEFGCYIVSGDNKDINQGGAIPGEAGIKMIFSDTQVNYSSYTDGNYTITGNSEFKLELEKKYHASVWVQKSRLRLYFNDFKVLDVPKALETKFKYNIIRFQSCYEAVEPMITNIRIAAGMPDMRNKLVSEGKLVSYGIYFDSGKDVVKAESYGTMKAIAQVLKENPTLKVKIIGHTDSDGNQASNLDLSKRRAQNIKKAFVSDFGIDASRMETDGRGQIEPVAQNNTCEGKAQNRRVEFLKI